MQLHNCGHVIKAERVDTSHLFHNLKSQFVKSMKDRNQTCTVTKPPSYSPQEKSKPYNHEELTNLLAPSIEELNRFNQESSYETRFNQEPSYEPRFNQEPSYEPRSNQEPSLPRTDLDITLSHRKYNHQIYSCLHLCIFSYLKFVATLNIK